MSANGIAHLSTREARQKAKLDLAATKRAADASNRDNATNADNRHDYDISQLPTQYYGNGITDNNNADGLVVGRPWISGSPSLKYAAGLYRTTYSGYFNDTPTWFATATATATAVDTSLTIGSIPTTTSIQFLGYFLARTTETYTFYTTSDDASYLWGGSFAAAGFTTANALVNNGGLHGNQERSGTIALTAGVYYPVRIQCGNNGGAGDISVAFSSPSIAKTTDFTDFIFYNTATNGI